MPLLRRRRARRGTARGAPEPKRDGVGRGVRFFRRGDGGRLHCLRRARRTGSSIRRLVRCTTGRSLHRHATTTDVVRAAGRAHRALVSVARIGRLHRRFARCHRRRVFHHVHGGRLSWCHRCRPQMCRVRSRPLRWPLPPARPPRGSGPFGSRYRQRDSSHDRMRCARPEPARLRHSGPARRHVHDHGLRPLRDPAAALVRGPCPVRLLRAGVRRSELVPRSHRRSSRRVAWPLHRPHV